MRSGLDALLRPVRPADATGVEAGAEDGRMAAPLVFLRGDAGRASVNSLREELARLTAVRAIGLPADLFSRWSPQELEACRQRVAVEAPYELRRQRRCRALQPHDQGSGHLATRLGPPADLLEVISA